MGFLISKCSYVTHGSGAQPYARCSALCSALGVQTGELLSAPEESTLLELEHNVAIQGGSDGETGAVGCSQAGEENLSTLGDLSTHCFMGQRHMMVPSFALNDLNLCWAKDAQLPHSPLVYMAIANSSFPRLKCEQSWKPGE